MGSVRSRFIWVTVALAPTTPLLPVQAYILKTDSSSITPSGKPYDPPLAVHGFGVPVLPGGLVTVQPPPPIIIGPYKTEGEASLSIQSSPSPSEILIVLLLDRKSTRL